MTRFIILTALVKVMICWSSSRSLLLECKRGVVVITKLSFRELRAIIKIMLSQIIQYLVTID